MTAHGVRVAASTVAAVTSDSRVVTRGSVFVALRGLQADGAAFARDAIAREESIPGDKVRMTFRVVLARQDAEALAARAIREEKNIVTLVTEILEAAAAMGQGGP